MLYDPETDILSWEVSEGKIIRAREFGNFIIHLSYSQKPVFIEIINASGFIKQFEKIKDLKNIKEVIPRNA